MPAIARTPSGSARRPTLRTGTDPATLSHNLALVLGYASDLQKEVDAVYRVLAKRTEEMLVSGTLAQRPTAGVANRIYFATDQALGSRLTFDTGTAWTAP